MAASPGAPSSPTLLLTPRGRGVSGGDSDFGGVMALLDAETHSQASLGTRSLRSSRSPRNRARYQRNRAFFFMYPDGWFRSLCIDIVCNPLADNIILALIVFNAVLVSIDDPLNGPQAAWWFVFMDVADSVSLGVFIVEMIVKMVAMGGIMHSEAYLRDVWNWLDFVIVVAGIVGQFLDGSQSLKVLRIIRIFRPLRTISRVQGMRDLVDTLGASLPILFHVVMLSMFLSYLFGSMGVILWSSTLHTRCYGIDPFTRNPTYTSVCSTTSAVEINDIGCPAGFECVADAPSPSEWANFDNIFYSNFIVLQCFTLDDYSTHMYNVQDGWSYFAAVYFVLLTLLGAYVVLNLVLAVVTDSFLRFAMAVADDEAEESMHVADAIQVGPGTLLTPVSMTPSGRGFEHAVPPALQPTAAFAMSRSPNRQCLGGETMREDASFVSSCDGNDRLTASARLQQAGAMPAVSVEETELTASTPLPTLGTLLSRTQRGGSGASVMGRPPKSPRGMQGLPSRFGEHRASDPTSDDGYDASDVAGDVGSGAGRTHVRQRSLFLKGGAATEGGAEVLLRDENTRREWDRFRAALGRSGQDSVDNYERLASQRAGGRRSSSAPPSQAPPLLALPDSARPPAAPSKRPMPLDASLLKIVVSNNEDDAATAATSGQTPVSVLRKRDSARRNTPQPTFVNLPKSAKKPPRLSLVSAAMQDDPPPYPGTTEVVVVRGEEASDEEPEGWRAAGYRVIDHPRFTALMTVLIVLNALFMSLESYRMSQGLVAFLSTANIVFVAAFTVEVVGKFVILRPKAWVRDAFNILDGVIVAMSLVELFFLASSTATVFRVLRLARVVRVVKLARRWQILRHIVTTVASSLSYMGYLMLLLMLFLFVFAVLGRQLFAGKMPRCCTETERATGLYNCDNGTDEHYLYDECWNSPWRRTHFDDLYWSMIAVFQVVTQDYWSAVMYKAMTGTHAASVVYFLAVIILGRYMLLNLFVAILLVGLERERRCENGTADDLEDPAAVCDDDDIYDDDCLYPPQERYNIRQREKKLKRRTKSAMRVAGDDTEAGLSLSPFRRGKSNSIASSVASAHRQTSTARPAGDPTSPLTRRFVRGFTFGDADDALPVSSPAPVESQASLSPNIVTPQARMLSPTVSLSDYSGIPVTPSANSKLLGVSVASMQPAITLTPSGRGGSFDSMLIEPIGIGSPMLQTPGPRDGSRRRMRVGSRKRSESLFRHLGELERKQEEDAVIAQTPVRRTGSLRRSFGSPASPTPGRPAVETPPAVPSSTRARRKFDTVMRGLLEQAQAEPKESMINKIKEGAKKRQERAVQIQNQRAAFRGIGGHEEAQLPADSDESESEEVPQPGDRRRWRRGSWHYEQMDDGRTVIFRQGRIGLNDWYAFVLDEDEEEIELLLGKSWGCVGPDNAVRKFLHTVVRGDYFPFERVIGYFIFFSCLLLTLTPSMVSGADATVIKLIEVSDIFVAAIFAVELIMRITVYTFHSGEAGRSAYVRRARWNWVDLVIVLTSILTLPPQYLLQDVPKIEGTLAFIYKLSRAMRAFRPLRILVRSENMKIVISSLIGTIPAVFNVFAVASVSYFMFGVASVQLFRGAFMACNDGSNRTFEECDPSTYFVQPAHEPFSKWYNDSYLPPSPAYPLGAPLIRRRWVNMYSFNFNNIGESLYCLLEMAIMNGWTNVLYAVVDASTEEDGGLRRNQQEWMGLMVVLWVFVGGLGIMNVFVGCVVDYFGRLKNLLDRSALLTKDQMQALRIKKILNSQHAKHRLAPTHENPSAFSKFCMRVVHTTWFRRGMFACILINVVCMTTVHHNQTHFWDKLQSVGNVVFNCIFTVEMLLKIGVGGPQVYLRTLWNKIDGLIVVVSWIETAVTLFLTNGRAASVISLLRLGRMLRLIRQVKGLKKLFLTMYFSLTALMNVGSLMALVFFIYGVMGTVFFEGVRVVEFDDDYLNGHYGFKTFPQAMLTLYRVATFDGWRQVFAACSIYASQCAENDDSLGRTGTNCGYTTTFEHVLVCLYFATFVLTVGFVMLNLFIAVVLENFQDSVLLPPPLMAKMELVKLFREVWAIYDPSALQIVNARHFVPLMMRLPPPLGFSECDRLEVLASLLHLDFPVTNEMDMLFMDVIDAIGETVFRIKLVDREATRLHFSHKTRDAKKDRERYQLGFTIGDYHAAVIIQGAWRRWRGPLHSDTRHPHRLCGNILADFYERSLRVYPVREDSVVYPPASAAGQRNRANTIATVLLRAGDQEQKERRMQRILAIRAHARAVGRERYARKAEQSQSAGDSSVSPFVSAGASTGRSALDLGTPLTPCLGIPPASPAANRRRVACGQQSSSTSLRERSTSLASKPSHASGAPSVRSPLAPSDGGPPLPALKSSFVPANEAHPRQRTLPQPFVLDRGDVDASIDGGSGQAEEADPIAPPAATFSGLSKGGVSLLTKRTGRTLHMAIETGSPGELGAAAPAQTTPNHLSTIGDPMFTCVLSPSVTSHGSDDTGANTPEARLAVNGSGRRIATGSATGSATTLSANPLLSSSGRPPTVLSLLQNALGESAMGHRAVAAAASARTKPSVPSAGLGAAQVVSPSAGVRPIAGTTNARPRMQRPTPLVQIPPHDASPFDLSKKNSSGLRAALPLAGGKAADKPPVLPPPSTSSASSAAARTLDDVDSKRTTSARAGLLRRLPGGGNNASSLPTFDRSATPTSAAGTPLLRAKTASPSKVASPLPQVSAPLRLGRLQGAGALQNTSSPLLRQPGAATRSPEQAVPPVAAGNPLLAATALPSPRSQGPGALRGKFPSPPHGAASTPKGRMRLAFPAPKDALASPPFSPNAL